MASLRQRGKSGAWYALFRDAGGKLREKPTHCLDRKTAQKMADEWEATARPSTGRRTIETMRRVMSEMHKDLVGREMLKMTPREFAKIWTETRKGEVSDATAVVYERVTREFVLFLARRADEEMFLVMREDVLRYRDWLGSQVSATTVNHHLRVLRMWFKSARVDGWLSENVAELVKPLKDKTHVSRVKKEKRPFSLVELRKLLQAAASMPDPKAAAEWTGLIIRGYYTGQRLGDIATMKVGCEDLLQAQVTMRTIKTGQLIVLEMHEAYLNFALSQTVGDDPEAPLHPLAFASFVKNKGRVVTLSSQFAELLIRAGLRPAKPPRVPTVKSAEKKARRTGKGELKQHYELSYHSLRHTFVSHLQDAGVAKSVVQDMVGHENAAVNRIYTHLDRETKRTAMQKLPDILGKE
jgi:integrase